MVVSDHQLRQCLSGFPGPTGFDEHFHAWQDTRTDSQNFPHSNVSCAFMTEVSQIDCHGFVSAVESGAR